MEQKPMLSVRIHGRGGQGVVSAAEMLSVAAFLEGKHAQAVPSFGSERMGAPVVAFCRIDDKPIRLREPVLEPDVLIVQDPTLFHAIDVFAGLASQGYLLVNTGRSVEELGIDKAVEHLPGKHVCTVPATEIAMKYVKRPVPNAVLLGALSAETGIVGIDSVVKAIETKFPGPLGQANITAAKAAYELAGGAGQGS
jgi:pyruvate ferredoxin oxidoreductase gamma subunit